MPFDHRGRPVGNPLNTGRKAANTEVGVGETRRVSTGKCMHCGEVGYLQLPHTGIEQYGKGAYVQDAFPDLDAASREQIISGVHPRCSDEMNCGLPSKLGDVNPFTWAQERWR